MKETLGLGESLTPREVLNALRDWELHGELEMVTALHERVVYGGMSPDEEELAMFRETVKKLLEAMGRE
jgi:hypothetical protein